MATAGDHQAAAQAQGNVTLGDVLAAVGQANSETAALRTAIYARVAQCTRG